MKLVPGASAEDIAYLDDVYEVVCDASDALWTTSLANTFVTRLDRQGVTLATAQVPEVPGPRSLAVDSSSQAWVANGRHVTRIAANGSLVGTYPVGGRVGAIAADPASGEIWVTVENTLVKLSAQGDVLATTPPFSTAPSNDFAGLAIDAAGHVWVSVLSDGTIAHFGPDGGFLSRHALGWPARDLAFDSAGHLWAVGGTNADPGSGRAAKLSASGRLLEVYMNAPSLIDTVVIAPNDQVWVKGIYGDVYRLAP
jgi:streptogramin lyase